MTSMISPPVKIREKDRSIKSELSNDDEWAEVDKYRQLLHDKEQQEVRDRKEQQRLQTKAELDAQLREKRARKEGVRAEKQRNDDMVLQQVSDYRKY
jgi:hypothetical protein